MGDDAVDEDRESLEKQKLKLEIKELARPWWAPTNLLSMGTTVLSLVVVFLTIANRDVEVQRLENAEWDARHELEQVTADLAAKEAELEKRQAELGELEADRNNMVAEFQKLKTDFNSLSSDFSSAKTPQAVADAAKRARDVNTRTSRVIADRETYQKSYVSAKSELSAALSAGRTGKALAEALDRFRKARLYASASDQAEDAALIKRASDALKPRSDVVARPASSPSKRDLSRIRR